MGGMVLYLRGGVTRAGGGTMGAARGIMGAGNDGHNTSIVGGTVGEAAEARV